MLALCWPRPPLWPKLALSWPYVAPSCRQILPNYVKTPSTCHFSVPAHPKRGNSAVSKGDHLEMMSHQALRDLNVSNSTPKMPSRLWIEK